MQTLGAWGEAVAQAEYKKRGFSIVDSNVYNRRGKRVGEIDFIAKNKHSIVFVEVKTRTAQVGQFGSGADSVNIFKQRKLLKAMKLFLLYNPQYRQLQPQIDICVITPGEIDKNKYSVIIIPNAVEDMN